MVRKLLRFGGILCIFTLLSVCSYSDDEIVNPEFVNLETIKNQENLSDNIGFKRVYLFVAVQTNKDQYAVYVARGDSDEDSDGNTVIEEPNDLEGYKKLDVSFNKKIEFQSDDSHTCLITSLPNFSELFPEEIDPFEDDSIVEVETEPRDGDNNHLEGITSLPLVDANGITAGVERYCAFYNKSKDGVSSFGFIHMQVYDAS
jgi:hypothetical protein